MERRFIIRYTVPGVDGILETPPYSADDLEYHVRDLSNYEGVTVLETQEVEG